MSRLRGLAAACALAITGLTIGAGPAGSVTSQASETGSPAIVVELDESDLQAGPGEKIAFTSTVQNNADQPLTGYVAHLNILTTDESVYVDPEDWSPERTQYLDDIPAGGSASLDWSVQAVTKGPLILFVSVTSPDSDTVVSSGPLNLEVTGQRVVSSAGVVPLVLWMPAGVLALVGATLLRRRNRS